jgi:hypothetical protein
VKHVSNILQPASSSDAVLLPWAFFESEEAKRLYNERAESAISGISEMRRNLS